MSNRPSGSDADEWHLFLCEHLDNLANSPHVLAYIAVQIAEALDQAQERGRQLYILAHETETK